ncbi:MAG: hypothetical protein ACOYYS_27890 [Chloroflexota bacterium]
MFFRKHTLWVIVVLLLALTFARKVSHAQSNTRYFPETGHWVTDAFLTMYNGIPNPEALYGLPITDAFRVEAVAGSPEVWMQYFERARFEYRPDNPVGLQVTLSNIGVYLYDHRTPGEIVTAQPGVAACQFFSQTGYQVCYAFLDFYNQNGGVAQFGYPISEVETQDGRMTQYFQRARFEWHPHRPTGQRVVLTDIGKAYVEMVEDPYLLQPVDGGTANVLLGIKVQAFVDTAVVGRGEEQTLSVIVRDQNYQPIENAQVTFSLDLPDGEVRFLMQPTDENGVTKLDFVAPGTSANIVPIIVTVNYEKFEQQTVASYRVWW